MTRRPPEPPKPFDLSASHPRPDIRPSSGGQSPFTPYTPGQASPQSPFEAWQSNATNTGKLSPQAASETHTSWDPKPAAAPITDPAALKQKIWNEDGSQEPEDNSGTFTDADALLAQMGLPPLKKPTEAAGSETPYVQPHPTTEAEFSPPRPVRRAPVRFAHLSPDNTKKTED